MTHPPSHEVKRPVAQFYNPNSGDKAPLAALLTALSKTPAQIPGVAGIGSPNDGAAAFTARLCSALSLQRDSLLSNIHNSKNTDESQYNQQELKAAEKTPTEQSSSQGPKDPGPSHHGEELQGAHEVNETQHAVNGNLERETSSTDVNATGNTTSDKGQQPMSEDAKKRRRQEINRESARRVRKRKTEAHVQLQEEVIALKAAASSSAADQAVIVRYASELTKERDALLQRAATLENKWIAAECRNVILRQRIADLTGTSLQQVAPDTGQVLSHYTLSEQKTECTAPESSTQFNGNGGLRNDGRTDHSK